MAEDLTVLIANLGQIHHLRTCLASLFDTLNGKTSVRVIVGFNFEGDSDIPRRLATEFPQVEVVRSPVQLGYCRAYNLLMDYCNSRYVLVLDDDTVLRPGTIDDVVTFMDANPRVGIAGCRTVNPDGSFQKTTALVNSLRTEFFNILQPAAFWRDGIDRALESWAAVEWLNGHYMMCRAEVIRDVGGFDERYFTIQCEADWCLRISRAGWTVAYVPTAEIMHIGGAQSIMTREKTFNNLLRSQINRFYFMRKHYGRMSFAVFRLIMSAEAFVRLVLYVAVWCAVPKRRAEAAPKIKAYGKTVLLAFARRPDRLPAFLQGFNTRAANAKFDSIHPLSSSCRAERTVF